MATITLNPSFDRLNSRIGRMIFYTRSGTQCVRSHVKPRNPDTPEQRKNRNTFREAVKLWQSLTEEEKNVYRKKARRLRITGYNLFISRYLKGKQAVDSGHNPEQIQSSTISAPYPLRSLSEVPPVQLQYIWNTRDMRQEALGSG